LAPAAVSEVIDTLSWNGFGIKAQRTKQSALSKMLTTNQRLNDRITLTENIAEGTAPDFDGSGFTKPKAVELIRNGALVGSLVSGRSAKEFNLTPGGASEDESPESIDLTAGTLASGDILKNLDTGVYVNNLWYLNYSDRNACRLTGMTRFASFWVEHGKIVAPLNVMRFDDTVFDFLGNNLIGLTTEREFMMGSSTYSQRSTNSSRLPGVLIKDFCFTL
jgi:predicted Zn-dependent protease